MGRGRPCRGRPHTGRLHPCGTRCHRQGKAAGGVNRLPFRRFPCTGAGDRGMRQARRGRSARFGYHAHAAIGSRHGWCTSSAARVMPRSAQSWHSGLPLKKPRLSCRHAWSYPRCSGGKRARFRSCRRARRSVAAPGGVLAWWTPGHQAQPPFGCQNSLRNCEWKPGQVSYRAAAAHHPPARASIPAPKPAPVPSKSPAPSEAYKQKRGLVPGGPGLA